MYNIPMSISSNITSTKLNIDSNINPVKFDMGDFVGPVELDFTSEIEMLPVGSSPSVEYSKKHFTFKIPYVEVDIISEGIIRSIVSGAYEED